ELVIEHFGIETGPANLEHWTALVEARKTQDTTVRVAMVGKYVDLADAYKSVNEALSHAGLHTGTRVQIDYVDSDQVARDAGALLDAADAILVPGGFGERGVDGKLEAVRHARENRIPYFGICLGMQMAAIEFARNVAMLEHAHSTEFDPDTPHPVIALVTEWRDRADNSQQRTAHPKRGATMRLGEQHCRLDANTLAALCYGTSEVLERHRHRYE